MPLPRCNLRRTHVPVLVFFYYPLAEVLGLRKSHLEMPTYAPLRPLPPKQRAPPDNTPILRENRTKHLPKAILLVNHPFRTGRISVEKHARYKGDHNEMPFSRGGKWRKFPHTKHLREE